MSQQAPRVVRPEGLDWVKFDKLVARDGSVPPTWKALYAALASFAEPDSRETPNGPEDDDDIPTRQRLAECIGMSVDTVDRATKGLEGIRLLEVERRKDPDNPKRNIPSLYRLLDYEIWDERAAARAEKRRADREAKAEARAAAKKAAEAEADTGGGSRTGAATPGRTGAARVAAPMRPGWPHRCGGSSSSPEDLSLQNARGTRDESDEREREAAAPENGGGSDADLVLAAYEEALGGAALNGTRVRVLKDAAELLAVRPLWWVQARARELPQYGTSLAKHAAMSTAPFTGVPGEAGPGAGGPGGGRERCPDHPARYRKGCVDCAMAVPA